eukprot:9345149-Pyramimonas_sp.AAC.1
MIPVVAIRRAARGPGVPRAILFNFRACHEANCFLARCLEAWCKRRWPLSMPRSAAAPRFFTWRPACLKAE